MCKINQPNQYIDASKGNYVFVTFGVRYPMDVNYQELASEFVDSQMQIMYEDGKHKDINEYLGEDACFNARINNHSGF